MKRMIALLIMLALCATNALAEANGYWTANEDWYYHLSEYCGGSGRKVPISLDGAEAFEKYPCPICVPTRESAEIQAALCFGQLALRVPEAWMWDLKFENIPGERMEGVHQRGEEALRTLGQCVHGKDYARFLDELQRGGGAVATAWIPSVGSRGQDAPLSLRHIGGAWYAGVRPGEDPASEWNTVLQVRKLELEMAGDALNTHSDAMPAHKFQTLQPEEKAPLYQRQDAGLWVHIYPLGDIYYLCLTGKTETNLEGATLRLRIGGAELDVDLWPVYISDIADIGVALTAAEFRALELGAPVEIADMKGNVIAFAGDAG